MTFSFSTVETINFGESNPGRSCFSAKEGDRSSNLASSVDSRRLSSPISAAAFAAEVGSPGLSLKPQPRTGLYDIDQIQRNGRSTCNMNRLSFPLGGLRKLAARSWSSSRGLRFDHHLGGVG